MSSEIRLFSFQSSDIVRFAFKVYAMCSFTSRDQGNSTLIQFHRNIVSTCDSKMSNYQEKINFSLEKLLWFKRPGEVYADDDSK